MNIEFLMEYASFIDNIFIIVGAILETLLVLAFFLIYKNRKSKKKIETEI